jgi:hypothetical protein
MYAWHARTPLHLRLVYSSIACVHLCIDPATISCIGNCVATGTKGYDIESSEDEGKDSPTRGILCSIPHTISASHDADCSDWTCLT